MDGRGPALFAGVTAAQRARVVADLERRRFPAGAVVIAEGDAPHALYVLEEGAVEVVGRDDRGAERRLGRIGPGEAFGEISFLTGRPASATVRATADVVALVLDEAALARAAAEAPALYRNLGAILAARLARSNRRALGGGGGLSLLLDGGAPPLLARALAAGVAWHTRAAVLLLVLRPGEPGAEPDLPIPMPVSGRAQVARVPPTGPFAPGVLAQTLEDLRGRFGHVLVVVPDGQISPDVPAATVRLGASGGAAALPAGSPEIAFALRGWATGPGSGRPDAAGVVEVPAPGATEEGAIRDGLLSPEGPAGAALGWAARRLAGLRVGLALGGGGLRGYAHVGVLRAVARLGLPVDAVAGTSIGAAMAAGLALGLDLDRGVELMDRFGRAAVRPTVPVGSLLSNAGLRRGLRAIYGGARIEEARTPLGVVTVDLAAREEVVLRTGPAWEAVLASLSIPGFYPPVRVGGRLLVDGAILNPVPVDTTAWLGADVVVAVRLRTDDGGPPGSHRGPRSLPGVLLETFGLMQGKIGVGAAGAATVTIEPVCRGADGWGLRRFREGRRFIPAGEEAVEAALPRLAAALPWLRP